MEVADDLGDGALGAGVEEEDGRHDRRRPEESCDGDKDVGELL